MSGVHPGERGDWAYIPAFTFALALFAAVALALDAEAVALGHARLWSATALGARAGARCLLGSPSNGQGVAAAQACVASVASTLVPENLRSDGLSPQTTRASVTSQDSVQVTATADMTLPLPLPGSPAVVSLTADATALLLPSVTTATAS